MANFFPAIPKRVRRLGFLFSCLGLLAFPAQARFSSELCKDAQPTYQAILRHPFLKGLSDGSLPEEAFRYYVVQDALYLKDFARALSALAAKAPRESWTALFAEHAKGALVAERALHESFFKEWGLKEEQVYATPQAPSNLAYTSYLLRVAQTGSFEELLGAVLPCYWIYQRVGQDLEARGSPLPLYKRWIDTYASQEFESSVGQVLRVMDQAASDLPESRKALIRGHFLVTSRYEWMFWDAAWRLETWPARAARP